MNQLLGQGNQQAQYRSDQPHAINVNVVVKFQDNNLNLQLSIDPEIPFNVFANGIKEHIFAQRMQAQYEQTIEYQLGNGPQLWQTEARTLQSLGFTNNCTLYVRLKLQGEYEGLQNKLLHQQGYQTRSSRVNFEVVIYVDQENINLPLSFDPQTSFTTLVKLIKKIKKLFTKGMLNQYEETIKYKLNNEFKLQQNETKTLEQLGFTNNCQLHVKLKRKEIEKKGNLELSKKRIYKVLIDLQYNKIEFYTAQYINTPVSCVLYDILIDLFEKQQLSIQGSFIYFVDDVEVEPFDCRLLEEFQTKKNIKLKLIPPIKISNPLANEKIKFVLKNKNKQNKLNFKKFLKIECNPSTLERLTPIDTSLEELIQEIIYDLQIKKNSNIYSFRYIINDKEITELNSIFSNTDFKIDISSSIQSSNKSAFTFRFTGEFQERIVILGKINNNQFLFEEFISLNASYDELLEYIKFKIFGPKQTDYKVLNSKKGKGFIEICYERK